MTGDAKVTESYFPGWEADTRTQASVYETLKREREAAGHPAPSARDAADLRKQN
jgi:hypothetical protein